MGTSLILGDLEGKSTSNPLGKLCILRCAWGESIRKGFLHIQTIFVVDILQELLQQILVVVS